MSKIQEYLTERIKHVKDYIDFFAHKELESLQLAQKYIELTEQFGCPIEVFVEAIKDGIIVEKYRFDVESKYDFDDTYVHSNIVISKNLGLFMDYDGSWFIFLETEDDYYYYKLSDHKKTWWVPSDFKAKLVKGFWRW